MQYHIVLGEKLLPTDLRSGIHKNSMLGLSYWLMFYQNSTQVRKEDCSALWRSGLTYLFLRLVAGYIHFCFAHPHEFTVTVWQLLHNPCKWSWRLSYRPFSSPLQKFVNNIPLDGKFLETKNGMLIGVSQVLQIQKNRCTANTTTIQKVMVITEELTTISQGFSTCWTKLMNRRQPTLSLPRGWDSSLWSDPRWASCEMGHPGDLAPPSLRLCASNAADLQLLCRSRSVHLLGLPHSASRGAGWCRDSQMLSCGRRIQPNSCMAWPQGS